MRIEYNPLWNSRDDDLSFISKKIRPVISNNEILDEVASSDDIREIRSSSSGLDL